MKSYSVRVRIDRRDRRWDETVRSLSGWMQTTGGYRSMPVPAAARDPLYSTWYAFTQNVSASKIEDEARRAAALGMKTLILDDGWQTDETGRAYERCGDLTVSKAKFPDGMAAHVGRVRSLGVKYMVWYAVPFVGFKNAEYERFKGKYLKTLDSIHCSVLDPRFPEVRAYLADLFERAQREWGGDGFKLDYIGQFDLNGQTDPAVAEDYAGRDFRGVPDAVDALMAEILRRLTAANPDVLIEYRQPYISPAIRRFGNMIRAIDCPGEMQKNIVRTAMLRLTSGDTAVHSDMLEWNVGDTPEHAAKTILASLFSTVQYSMVLSRLPESHLAMMRHWIGFTQAHRRTLLQGKMTAFHPELNYPVLSSETDEERVLVDYADCGLVRVPDARRTLVVNATGADSVALELPAEMTACFFDTFGRPVRTGRVGSGLSRQAVPVSGYVELSLPVPDPHDIVVETEDFRLTVGTNALVKSLLVRKTGVETVDPSWQVPLCAAVQDRPFNNEFKLIHPNKRTTYPATGLRREGERLIASFSHGLYEAVVAVRKGAGYASFELEDFKCDRKSTYDYLKMDIPPVTSFRILQLPVRERRNFGDWLNACWDDRAAVGVIGTSPYPDIDHEDRPNGRLLYGELIAGRKLRGAGAALIAAPGREAFLDAMDAVETDFRLPHGVRSRRSPYLEEFIFHVSVGFTPAAVDEVIGYVQKGGFKLVTFGMQEITDEIDSWGKFGNYDLRKDFYPNGLPDLRRMLDRFHRAGIKVGLHTVHPHIGLKSRYVTPVADSRLNKTRRFTLAESLPDGTNDIASVAVLEPTADTVMFEPCRLLQFGGEILSYESYTTEPPYRFLGVRRGVWATRPTAHARGEIGGILDVSEYGKPQSCYIDQNTDLQDEIAEKIAAIYNCGFDYVYLDGSEGVNRPYGYHVANGQYRLWKRLVPEPLFGEGAAKTHFGWHMLAGANAFDCFSPKVFKEKLRAYPFKQAPFTWQDMSRVDFGWWGFWAPGSCDWWKETVGVQADMWEYGASVATAWKCAGSILMRIDELRKHRRLDDILETMRRWADVRRSGQFREEWRDELKDVSHEHHLLVDAKGRYDLVRYEMVADGFGPSRVRAFVFEKDGSNWVVYWHRDAEGRVKVPLKKERLALFDGFEGRPVGIDEDGGFSVLPTGDRLYLRTDVSKAEVVRAFAAAEPL